MMVESWRREFIGRWIALPAMFAILLLLGYLQYRWSGEVGEAVTERTRREMGETARRIRAEFVKELLKPCEALQVNAAASLDKVRQVISQQLRSASRTDALRAVGAVYLAVPNREGYAIELVTERGTRSGTPYPSYWRRLEPELNFNIHARPLGDKAPQRRLCMLDGEILVMHHTIEFEHPASARGSEARDILAYVLIEFRQTVLRDQVLPQLVKRYLGDDTQPKHHIAVVRGESRADILYTNAGNRHAGLITNPDVSVQLLGGAPAAPRDEASIPLVRGNRAWYIAVQHSEGSLQVAGRRATTQNLVLGLGVLLLLAANVVLLLFSTEKARQLARTQISFVASVSHELRTPVTAICVMADNLARGIAASSKQTQHYGELLREQGGRLAAMVDHILQFAEVQQRPLRYELKPVHAARIIHVAVEAQRAVLDASGTTVEVIASPDLPPLLGDETALLHCLENLLSNARKYADGGQIAITSQLSGRRDVVITVRDQGPGVPKGEQALIFDPFYRGTSARESQMPGSGLGLSLVKQMVEAMGGRIILESEPGKGTAFSLHLRAAPAMHFGHVQADSTEGTIEE